MRSWSGRWVGREFQSDAKGDPQNRNWKGNGRLTPPKRARGLFTDDEALRFAAWGDSGQGFVMSDVSLKDVVKVADEWLRVRDVPDYSQAHNGLQLENSGSVRRLVAAVDACEAVLSGAATERGTLLVVHHGLFWNPSVWTGATYRKLRVAFEGDLAVYSAHLPLDVHPDFGNNVLLARRLGLSDFEPVLDFKGMSVGLVGRTDVPREVLVDALTAATGVRTHVCAGGPAQVRRVAVVTGGAGSEVARVAAAGVDTFVTGEGPHWSYTLAEELGVNLLYGGHYATETFGVRALAERLGERFGLPWEFLDHPTGL